ncbi:MAG: cytidylate kinase-like family protein [Candidatus Eremiobacteraeota bacterium]|nr:cytidylate kinase-like family protein [Candidatus Eremiobacteraeota bacterium]
MASRTIVTISNEYGCGAHEIARAAAAELGFRFIDKELPVVVAKRLQTSPDVVDASEDTSRNLGERLIFGLEAGTPELASATETTASFDQDLRKAVAQAVREFAEPGNVVLFGRGSNAILGRRDDVLRIFMHAPRAWRIAHIIAAGNVDQKTATSEVDRIDKARRTHMRENYDVDWGDPSYYDLSIDTAHFGPERARALIAAAVSMWQ